MTNRQSIGMKILAGGIMLAIVTVPTVLDARSDSDASCYEDLRKTYTWNYRMNDLDEIWADRKVSNWECGTIRTINAEAQKEAVRSKVKAEVDAQKIRIGREIDARRKH